MKPELSSKWGIDEISESLKDITEAVSKINDRSLKTSLEFHIEKIKLRGIKVEALEALAQPQNILASVEVAIAKCDFYAELASLKSSTLKFMLERDREEAKSQETQKVFAHKASQTSHCCRKRKKCTELTPVESKRAKITETSTNSTDTKELTSPKQIPSTVHSCKTIYTGFDSNGSANITEKLDPNDTTKLSFDHSHSLERELPAVSLSFTSYTIPKRKETSSQVNLTCAPQDITSEKGQDYNANTTNNIDRPHKKKRKHCKRRSEKNGGSTCKQSTRKEKNHVSPQTEAGNGSTCENAENKKSNAGDPASDTTFYVVVPDKYKEGNGKTSVNGTDRPPLNKMLIRCMGRGNVPESKKSNENETHVRRSCLKYSANTSNMGKAQSTIRKSVTFASDSKENNSNTLIHKQIYYKLGRNENNNAPIQKKKNNNIIQKENKKVIQMENKKVIQMENKQVIQMENKQVIQMENKQVIQNENKNKVIKKQNNNQLIKKEKETTVIKKENYDTENPQATSKPGILKVNNCIEKSKNTSDTDSYKVTHSLSEVHNGAKEANDTESSLDDGLNGSMECMDELFREIILSKPLGQLTAPSVQSDVTTIRMEDLLPY